ncbi:MAG: hypothetical protein PF795_12475, partial [Kiritimatiellae bacterium]|nr:hypothetical protein [Kiritimatiellia bacterium]
LVSGATPSSRSRQRETRPAARDRGSDMLALLQGGDRETPAEEPTGQGSSLPGLAERRQNRVGSDLLNVVMEV